MKSQLQRQFIDNDQKSKCYVKLIRTVVANQERGSRARAVWELSVESHDIGLSGCISIKNKALARVSTLSRIARACSLVPRC